jgi:hypothetical protein
MLLLWQDAVFVYVQVYTQWFRRESWSNILFPRYIRGTAMSVLSSHVSHDYEEKHTTRNT